MGEVEGEFGKFAEKEEKSAYNENNRVAKAEEAGSGDTWPSVRGGKCAGGDRRQVSRNH